MIVLIHCRMPVLSDWAELGRLWGWYGPVVLHLLSCGLAWLLYAGVGVAGFTCGIIPSGWRRRWSLLLIGGSVGGLLLCSGFSLLLAFLALLLQVPPSPSPPSPSPSLPPSPPSPSPSPSLPLLLLPLPLPLPFPLLLPLPMTVCMCCAGEGTALAAGGCLCSALLPTANHPFPCHLAESLEVGWRERVCRPRPSSFPASCFCHLVASFANGVDNDGKAYLTFSLVATPHANQFTHRGTICTPPLTARLAGWKSYLKGSQTLQT